MSFRGFDFTPGFNRYADLLRAAYNDRFQEERARFQDSVNAYQANYQYGYPSENIQLLDNPLYQGSPEEEVVPPAQPGSFSQGLTPEQMMYLDTLGLPPPMNNPMQPMQRDVVPMPFEGDRSPAVLTSKEITRETRSGNSQMPDEIKEIQGLSAQRVKEALKGGVQPQAPSVFDQLMKNYGGKEKLTPFEYRQMMDLVERRMAREGQGEDNPLTLALKALTGTRDTQGERVVERTTIKDTPPRQGRTPPASEQEKALAAQLKMIADPFQVRGLLQAYGFGSDKSKIPQLRALIEKKLADAQYQRTGGGKQEQQAAPIVSEEKVKQLAAAIRKKNPKISAPKAEQMAREALLKKLGK